MGHTIKLGSQYIGHTVKLGSQYMGHSVKLGLQYMGHTVQLGPHHMTKRVPLGPSVYNKVRRIIVIHGHNNKGDEVMGPAVGHKYSKTYMELIKS